MRLPHFHALDPRSLNGCDLKLQSIDSDLFPLLGHAANVVHDETTDGIRGLLVQFDLK